MRRSHFSVFANDGSHGASRSLRSTIKTVFFFFFSVTRFVIMRQVSTYAPNQMSGRGNPAIPAERRSELQQGGCMGSPL